MVRRGGNAVYNDLSQIQDSRQLTLHIIRAVRHCVAERGQKGLLEGVSVASVEQPYIGKAGRRTLLNFPDFD